MKKLLVIAAAFMLATTGCGGKDDSDSSTPETVIANKCFQGAPDWVIAGGAEGGVSSVGAAQISKAGLQFARTAALGNARDEMARNISVKVNNMLKDFTQVTGIGDDEVVDKVTASVSKQVASETLQGTQQRALWTSPCNELYVLITVNEQAVQKSVKDSVTSSFRNDNALWQQFQAQKAQDELDAAIMNEFQ